MLPSQVVYLRNPHSEELHLQRLNALCRLCGRNSNKVFDDRKIILCKTYATELSVFLVLKHEFGENLTVLKLKKIMLAT